MQLSRKEFFGIVAQGAAGSVVASAAGADVVHALAAGAEANPNKVQGAAIKGATDAVVKFITKADLRGMPQDVVQQGKRCLIDGFGVILAGSTLRGSANRARVHPGDY